MNEVEYVFNSDIREKKRTARGSRNKVNGAKSQKCNLPHERMTRKELKAMNGQATTYKLSEFYSWDQFLGMPSDIQVEYINRMSEHYQVGLSTLSVVLFGRKDDQAIRKHFIKAGLMSKLKVERYRGGKSGRIRLVDDMRNASIAEMETALSSQVIKASPDLDQVEKPIQELVPPTGYASPALSHIKDLVMEMDGFDMETFYFLANKYRDKQIKLSLSITVLE